MWDRNYNNVCWDCRTCTRKCTACPHCGKPTVTLSYKIRVPPRQKVKLWDRLKRSYYRTRYPRKYRVPGEWLFKNGQTNKDAYSDINNWSL